MSCPGAAPSLICLDQSQTSIQVTWSVLTNRRPVFRSPDLSWPIRAQSKHVTVSRNRSSYLCEQRVLQIWDQIWNLTQSHFVAAPSRTQMTLVASFFWRLFLYLTAVWNIICKLVFHQRMGDDLRNILRHVQPPVRLMGVGWWFVFFVGMKSENCFLMLRRDMIGLEPISLRAGRDLRRSHLVHICDQARKCII